MSPETNGDLRLCQKQRSLGWSCGVRLRSNSRHDDPLVALGYAAATPSFHRRIRLLTGTGVSGGSPGICRSINDVNPVGK